MSEIYLYHHLGLGDHISCHGIVRYYCEKYNKVKIFIQTVLKNNKNVDLNELVSAIINVDPTIEQNMIQEILSQLGVTYPK